LCFGTSRGGIEYICNKISEEISASIFKKVGCFEMEVVELFELVLRVHQTERYRIKSIENNAIDFAFRIAANLIRPQYLTHLKQQVHFHLRTCLHLSRPVYTKG
jgi:hypothetical protein